MKLKRINNVNFGVKIPTKGALQILAGRPLYRTIRASFPATKVIIEMTGSAPWSHQVPELTRQCRSALMKESSLLKEIGEKGKSYFDKKQRTWRQAYAWVSRQMKKLEGKKELEVSKLVVNRKPIERMDEIIRGKTTAIIELPE